MYKVILFDLDGTLTDPKEGITKSVQYALKAMGINEENLERLEGFIGPPLLEQFSEQYGMSLLEAKKAVEKYRERFADIGWKENLLHMGVEKVLRMLENDGRTIGLASSKPTIFCEQILQLFEIRKYFKVVVGSELDGRRTDKAEVVEEALRQLGIKGSYREVVLIGDRMHDIVGGKKNNISTIGIRLGFAKENELEEAMADIIVKDFDELEKILG